MKNIMHVSSYRIWRNSMEKAPEIFRKNTFLTKMYILYFETKYNNK